MSYSRRQLYAFGEPLGDCVTRKEGGRIVYGDGGGGQSSSGTTTQISELPEWAKGYAKDTLAKTGALTDINQNPYKPYEANRIAGFSPLQQQAQQRAANMQTSGATGFGTQLAGAAGLGALGARYDPTQFQADQFGGDAAQQYMSPYMQNVVDIQQREAQRQADIQGTQRGAQAVKSGAFGGSRQAIMDAEAARNLSMQKGDIQAQGLQSAYQQAQNQFNADQARRMQAQQLAEQSKQYGAGYGMQGLQTALQGAGQLGTLGGQEFAQGMDINKLQNAYGGQQQALQQQGLTQAYQDFQNQQNYPYKQLGFMSDMIRGLPLGQQSTRQVYEAEPGMAQQLGSLGASAYGLSRFMADGGMAYARGGGVDSAENVADIVGSLNPQQLQQSLAAAQARNDSEQARAIQDEMGFQASLKNGLASTVTPDMAQRMAGGGVVAFAKGGNSSISEALTRMREASEYTAPTAEETLSNTQSRMPGLQSLYGESRTAPYMEEVKADREKLKSGLPEDEAAGYFAASRAILKGKGIIAGLANAVPAYGEKVMEIKKENRKADQLLRASEIQLATADQARADGMVGKAAELEKDAQAKAQKAADMKADAAQKEATILANIRGQDVQAASSSASANKKTFEQESVDAKLAAAIAADPSIAKDPVKLAAAKKAAYSETAKETRPASSVPDRLQSQADIAKAERDAKARQLAEKGVAIDKLNDPVWREARKNKDTDGMKAREKQMVEDKLAPAASAPNAPPIPVAGRGSAAASVSLQARVEQSGQVYEPNKYDYRVAPDGSIQRKAK